MVEDTAVTEQTEQPSTVIQPGNDNQGKSNDENNGMPARSINMYDDFTVNSYIFILYGR